MARLAVRDTAATEAAMKFKELIDSWSQSARPVKTAREYAVRLSVDDAARIHALAELFPGHTEEDVITDLLSVALQEVEGAMPYRPGPKVISQDEQGDPIYEDVGLTPRFGELVKKYRQAVGGKSREGGRSL
jgi:ssRNA-specific RNase YbeY (16S rRNA maturation enzyme)